MTFETRLLETWDNNVFIADHSFRKIVISTSQLHYFMLLCRTESRYKRQFGSTSLKTAMAETIIDIEASVGQSWPWMIHPFPPAAAVNSLSSPVLRCCFRALLHFVRSAARRSQDIMVDVDTLHISYADIFISQVRAAGGSPLHAVPDHRRGLLFGCDHPPYGGHDPTIAVSVV